MTDEIPTARQEPRPRRTRGRYVPTRPRLLVSVRNTDEACEAIAGGCEILDVKEPRNGSLGMAESGVIQDVCNVARTSRVSASAALGETRDWLGRIGAPALPEELQYVKLGTAGLAGTTDWTRRWSGVREQFDVAAGRRLNWIAVAYADWKRVGAPPPKPVIDAALASDCAGVLFDTFVKDGRTLFDELSPESLRGHLQELRDNGLLVALAGSLSLCEIPMAAELRPDVIAVRTAACAGGNRIGPVSASAVRRLGEMLVGGRIDDGTVSAGE